MSDETKNNDAKSNGDEAKSDDKKQGAHVAVRLSVELVARLDAVRSSLSGPWRSATRSDALRAVILRGLEVVEKELPPGSKTKA